MNKEVLNSLPQEVIEKAKDILKAYDEVTIIFEYGKYKVQLGTCLKNVYAEDFKVLGYIKKEDIFTKEDMIINYFESFHSYPIEYKGKRDWAMIKEIEGKWDIKFKLDDNGNIVRV